MRAVVTILAAVSVVGSVVPAGATPFWQKHNSPPPAQHQAAPGNSLMGQPHANAPAAPKQRFYGPGPHNGDWLRKYGNLSPTEQQKKLESDPVFRSLTPENQKRLIDRLNVFNSFSPAKKQQVLDRMERYEHLTQAQQKQADRLFQQYRALPPDQQSQVSQAYKELQKMSAEQRTQYFNSDEFRNGMNDQQRSLLQGMSELYPNPSR